MKRSPRALALSLGLASAAAASMALSAWGQAEDGRPVLHLDVPPPPPGSGGVDVSDGGDDDGPAVLGPAPAEGRNPAAFAYRDKLLPAPKRGAAPSEAEPVYGRHGFGVDRFTEARPDDHTRGDETLQYVGVFNPSVLPFKRMSVMDSIRRDYTLYVANSGTLQDLPVGGRPIPERDMFWGDVVVEFQPGVDVPIPSVAPDMRILSYEVEPRLTVSFSKDSSDNYFVRSDEADATGTHRLRFMVDAPAAYFAPDIPRSMRVRDIAAQAPAGLVKSLPSDVHSMASKALSKLSLGPNTRVYQAMNALTEHFRAFEARPLVVRTGDVFWDLFISQAGVCRHRAFAFMVTASGLGIPTRYVTNEAHAWVESWIPEIGWMRIDLGGAALRMQVDNANDKALYQPRGADPFAKPSSYADSYTQLEGDISGLSPEQIAERRPQTAQQGDGEGSSDSGDGSGSGGSGDGNSRNRSSGGEDAVSRRRFDPGAPATAAPNADVDMPVIGPGNDLPVLPESHLANKRRLDVRVLEVEPEGFRGEPLRVSGELRSKGEGVDGLPITILMAPARQSGKDAVVVGGTVTRADGSFAAMVEIPTDLDLRDYEVYASTPGDSRFAPAVSR